MFDKMYKSRHLLLLLGSVVCIFAITNALLPPFGTEGACYIDEGTELQGEVIVQIGSSTPDNCCTACHTYLQGQKPCTAFTFNIASMECYLLSNVESVTQNMAFKSGNSEIDECESNPCIHGMCSNDLDSFSCTCNPGYMGTTCDADVDECASNPCVHGTCVDGINYYTCICQSEWLGTHCDIGYGPDGCVATDDSCAKTGQPECQTNNYTGTWLTTLSGRTCQQWDDTYPHSHLYTYVGDHNYCRNPNHDSLAPWCFTTDPNMRYESCFPSCDGGFCVKSDESCARNGSPECLQNSYAGTKSSTVNGHTCQNWQLDTPQEHSLNYYPNHTYCRNPGGAVGIGPWCYTVTVGIRWEYCFNGTDSTCVLW